MFFVSEAVEIHANGVVLYVAISTGARLDFFDFALEICSFSKVPFSLLFTSFLSVLRVPGFMVLRIALKTPSSFFTFAATELCILLLSLALDAFHTTQITVRKPLVVYESILLVVSPTVKPSLLRSFSVAVGTYYFALRDFFYQKKKGSVDFLTDFKLFVSQVVKLHHVRRIPNSTVGALLILLFVNPLSTLSSPSFLLFTKKLFVFSCVSFSIVLLSARSTPRMSILVFLFTFGTFSHIGKQDYCFLIVSGRLELHQLPLGSRPSIHLHEIHPDVQPVIHLWDPLYTPGPETSRPGHLFGAPGPWVQEDVAAPFPLSRANFLHWRRFCVHRLEITSLLGASSCWGARSSLCRDLRTLGP